MGGYDVAQKLARRLVNNVRACILLGLEGVGRDTHVLHVDADARARNGCASACKDERALIVAESGGKECDGAERLLEKCYSGLTSVRCDPGGGPTVAVVSL